MTFISLKCLKNSLLLPNEIISGLKLVTCFLKFISKTVISLLENTKTVSILNVEATCLIDI